MPELLHKELTGSIIGAYYEVYNHTSRTYPEYIYESALMEELRRRGLAVTQQDEYQILYKGRLVGKQRLDLFVVQEIVVENKKTDKLTPLNKAQGYSYLKTVSKPVGLLFNFGGQSPEFERLYFDPAKRDAVRVDDPTIRQEATASADWLHPDLAYAIVGGLYEVHNVLGPGFVHRIYANACYQELRLRELAVQAAKRMQVTYKGTIIGDVAFGHLSVEDKIMVFPVAIGDIRGIHLDNIKEFPGSRF